MSFFLGLLMVAAALSALRRLWTLVRWLGRGTARWLKAILPGRPNPAADLWPRRYAAPAGSAVAFGYPARDWEALSQGIRKELLARGVRVPAVADPLAKLELAIEIERRALELARLKAERAEFQARIRARRPSRKSGQAAVPDANAKKVAEEHMALIRKALGMKTPQTLEESRQGSLGSGSDLLSAPKHPEEPSARLRH